MDYSLVARMNLRGLHPNIFFEGCRNSEVYVLVGAFRRKGVFFGHAQHNVRLADSPILAEVGLRRKVAWIAFRGSRIYPRHYRVYVLLGKLGRVGELAELGIGAPRRHVAIDHLLANRSCPRPRILVA